MAVRKGFEPLIRFMPYTRFPGVLLQPLGHLTAPEKSYLRNGKTVLFCSDCSQYDRIRRGFMPDLKTQGIFREYFGFVCCF